MRLRDAWLLAVLALGACGGPADPAVDAVDSAAEPAAAERDALEPELVATDAAGSPTTGRFELGVHYLRLSPTQPTSSNPDQVEVAEVFWYGCPHCYDFEPYLARWSEQKPEYVSFVRIPALWNATAFYLFLLRPPPWLAAATVVVLAVLTFVPLKFVHPIRVLRLRALNVAALAAWAMLALVALARGLEPGPWVAGGFVVIAIYFLTVGLGDRTGGK